jgi:hypothetical protein
MALNATTLKTSLGATIETKLRAAPALGIPAGSLPAFTAWCNALADAISTEIVNHLKANAEIDNGFANGNTGTTANVAGGYPITNVGVTGGIK